MEYYERLSSNRTLALYATLTAIFSALLAWRWTTRSMDGWGITFLIFALFFLFSTINFRILIIELTPQALKLKFGLISWRVPVENIAGIQPDHIPPFKRYGGAGVHFMMVDGRYRASFNFLEYPRVVIALKDKVGPVVDISFSTRQPEQIIQSVQSAVTSKESHS